jgi:hypothetical protein
VTLLEKASHISLIAASLGALAFMYEARHTKMGKAVRSEAPTLLGRKLNIAGSNWNRARLNAVIALSPTCKYCQASLPFYRRLSTAVHKGGSTTALVVFSSAPRAATEAWLKDEGLMFDQLVQVPFGDLGIRGTPTILLVDSDGKVTKVFDGRLSPDSEEDLIATVGP